MTEIFICDRHPTQDEGTQKSRVSTTPQKRFFSPSEHTRETETGRRGAYSSPVFPPASHEGAARAVTTMSSMFQCLGDCAATDFDLLKDCTADGAAGDQTAFGERQANGERQQQLDVGERQASGASDDYGSAGSGDDYNATDGQYFDQVGACSRFWFLLQYSSLPFFGVGTSSTVNCIVVVWNRDRLDMHVCLWKAAISGFRKEAHRVVRINADNKKPYLTTRRVLISQRARPRRAPCCCCGRLWAWWVK